jgi:hypothetical protein
MSAGFEALGDDGVDPAAAAALASSVEPTWMRTFTPWSWAVFT